ncbi:hypothetical protein DXG01_005242 [Tephrocybe rancida]|nr:hypothetical protein DXG01_005242 [Tephrocybe rancida]
MLAQLFMRTLSLAALVTYVAARPLFPQPKAVGQCDIFSSEIASYLTHNTISVARTSDFCSFDNWRGVSSLNNFDSFYGVENFDGSQGVQVISTDQEPVCSTQSIQIVQQRLLVLQEVAKMFVPYTQALFAIFADAYHIRRIITEQLCDVEAQTIVFEQWYSGLHGFSRDLRRHSGRHVGYDRKISSHHDEIFSYDGSLTSNDFGFSGYDLGKEIVIINGHNWDDNRSPASVEGAYRAANDAYHFIHSDLI